MAKYTLTIETNDPIELADITAAIAEEQTPSTDERLARGDLHRVDGDTLTPDKVERMVEALDKEPEAPKARRGRPAAKAPAASAVETIGGAQDPAEETPGDPTPSEVEQLVADVAKATGPVTAQDCKLALNAAMDRDVPPVVIQQKMIEKFGAGSVMKITEDRYPELKAFLESLTK